MYCICMNAEYIHLCIHCDCVFLSLSQPPIQKALIHTSTMHTMSTHTSLPNCLWWLMDLKREMPTSSGRWSGIRTAPTSSCSLPLIPRSADLMHTHNKHKHTTHTQQTQSHTVSTHSHTQYFSYWPTKKGEHETYGNIKVTIEDETAEHYYTTRVISISNAKVVVLSPRWCGFVCFFVDFCNLTNLSLCVSLCMCVCVCRLGYRRK